MFLARLQHAFDAGRPRFFSTLALAKRDSFLGHLVGPRHTEWVVYAKEPFGGPRQVLDYLGRYTHRVAISNSRLLELTDEHLTFRWKDYRHPGEPLPRIHPTLPAAPTAEGFQRTRHYGLLNRSRERGLADCRRLLGTTSLREVRLLPHRYEKLTGLHPAGQPARESLVRAIVTADRGSLADGACRPEGSRLASRQPSAQRAAHRQAANPHHVGADRRVDVAFSAWMPANLGCT
ncbi:protein of unknown function (plasmid) [Cupriavidus taiwanensis]|uniref:Transposase IS801/IS1294 domain-containing protein n=1 Tax=Cupriavidus taiwanensis TaxID=164546 RepID=A0A375I5Y3_9BURK|nr:hypothetical protein CT19425_U340023 [Cupriavidus taiwanensis]SPK74820.1 protein of unknown function [Cupriavidus taiwanensis]